MRRFGLHGLKAETAGQSGLNASSEGNLLGVVDAAAFRNSILRHQRLVALGAEPAEDAPRTAATASDATELLTQIRDILARIEAKD